MVTNDERRRVAASLRKLNFTIAGASKRDSWDTVRRAIGTYDERPFAGCVTFARLADLIDPDERQFRDATKTVDRDALLALAEGLENKANDLIRDVKYSRFQGMGPRMDKARQDAFEWRCIARLIRKALGGRWQ